MSFAHYTQLNQKSSVVFVPVSSSLHCYYWRHVIKETAAEWALSHVGVFIHSTPLAPSNTPRPHALS